MSGFVYKEINVSYELKDILYTQNSTSNIKVMPKVFRPTFTHSQKTKNIGLTKIKITTKLILVTLYMY